MQERGITVESIDEIREAVQCYVVHLAVKILQGSVGLENICKCARALQPKFLICSKLALNQYITCAMFRAQCEG